MNRKQLYEKRDSLDRFIAAETNPIEHAKLLKELCDIEQTIKDNEESKRVVTLEKEFDVRQNIEYYVVKVNGSTAFGGSGEKATEEKAREVFERMKLSGGARFTCSVVESAEVQIH